MNSTPESKIGDAEVAVENVDYTSDNASKKDLPASIQGLSDEDYRKTRRTATWKMDLQLLPILVIM